MKVGDLIRSKGCGGLHLIVRENTTHFYVLFNNHWRTLNDSALKKEWIIKDFEVISESR